MSEIDPNVLARVAAHDSKRVYRVYVGAPERFINQSLYVPGEPVEFPLETVTTADVTIGTAPAITIPVADASGYSNVGGAFNLSSNQGDTWVRYTGISGNDFTGCTAVYGAKTHFVGATVSLWVEITPRVTSVSGQEDWTETLIDRTYRMTGDHYNSDLMPEDSSILILESLYPALTQTDWTSYRMAALGYVRRWDVSGASDRRRTWSATVESIRTYVDQFQVGAGQFGKVNLASGQPVTASENLANPLDVPGEWLSGVITNTFADKITDDSIDDGPYVSQLQPTTVPEAEALTPHIVIQEVFFGDDLSPSLQWFQLLMPKVSPNHNPTGIDLSQYFITNKQTVFTPSNNNPFSEGPCVGKPHPAEIKGNGQCRNYIRLNGVTLRENATRAVFTNNKARFLARWNVDNDLQVFDWRDLPGFGSDGLSAAIFILDRNSDWLEFRGVANNEEKPQTIWDMIVWGTHTGTPWWNNTGDACDNDAQWNGSPVTTPAPGNSIRRYIVANDAAEGAGDWIEETNPNPALRRTDNDSVFIAVELPLIPTALSVAITASTPAIGETFPLSNSEYLRLEPEASFLDIKIDAEELRLEPRRNTNQWFLVARGINGTTPDSHAQGATIFYNNPNLGYIRLPWAESVELRRWERGVRFENPPPQLPGYAPVAPGIWEIWGSVEESPRYLGETNYHLDWVGGRAMVTYHADQFNPFVQLAQISPAYPLRHVMVVIKSMFLDGTYAMVNMLKVWRVGMSSTASIYPGIGNVVDTYLSQFFNARLLNNSDRIIFDANVFHATNGDVTITGGALGEILNGLAQTHGFCVEYTRDGKIRIRRHLFHPLAVRPPVAAVLGPQMWRGKLSPPSATYVSRAGAGQYVVKLHDPQQARVFQGVYPPFSLFGNVQTVERVMVGTDGIQATRVAQMLYLADPLISRELTGVTVGPFPELEVGMRVFAFDNSDDAHPDGRYVDCLVKSITHNDGGGEGLLLQEWRQG